jgi:exopolyphosphatase/pppGpp-phosphohydrolase
MSTEGPAPRVRLRLQPQLTTLEFEGSRRITLPVGPRGLADAVLLHDPPTPAEVERAIDVVEDALMASRLAALDRGELVTADALVLALPGMEPTPAAGLTRDDVEVLFQRLASRALGTPVSPAELPTRRDIAAALVILRECMHHLGFHRVGFSDG